MTLFVASLPETIVTQQEAKQMSITSAENITGGDPPVTGGMQKMGEMGTGVFLFFVFAAII